MDRPPFASLLLQLRQAAGLTQEELASRATVGVRTIRDLEAGRATRPQRSTVDLLAQALGLAGPTLARFEAASRGRPVPAVNLPRVEPLIGRDDEIAGLTALIEVADLVTVVGLTGVGKAALALTVAGLVADRFPGGVGAVRVSAASTESEILASAVTSLGASHVDELTIRRPGSDAWAPLRLPDPALLVVVNADRSPVAAAAITWLRRHTQVRIITTSRRPLGLPAEYQFVLGPLEVPPPDATGPAVFEYPAARLFLDRLRRVRAQPVAEADADVLGALVRRLGGLPFAVELAAARGRVLGLSELLARATGEPAGDGAAVQPVEAGVADPVGQTVRSAVLASWDLLTSLEQTCLCWLSVFQWRWSIDLAEELLAACPEVRDDDVVAVVDRLVGLGLVRARADAPVLRLHVFDAVRWVARDQARSRGILRAAQDQHATVMARLCARAAQWGDGEAETGAADAAGRTVSTTVISYLFADIQAAADHLRAKGRPIPRARAKASRGDAVADLHRGLVQWLGNRGLTP